MMIRMAKRTNLPELMPFFVRMNEVINRRTGQYDPSNEPYPSEELVIQAIDEDQLYICIEDGRIVAACMTASRGDAAYDAADWNVDAAEGEYRVLHALRVLPEYEGRGFATMLLQRILTEMEAQGMKAARLDVLEGYNIESLYLKLGFEYIETAEIFYEDIGYPQRFRLFEKAL